MPKSNRVRVSAVVPVFNEEENVGALFSELKAVLEANFSGFEIIFCDDGSTDGTFRKLESLRKKKPKILRIIRFRKNFGQTSAMKAGFDLARGDVVVTLDGDMQNDPADIPAMVWQCKKFDLVNGWRHNRRDPPGKRFFSGMSNLLARKLTGLELHDFGCTLRAHRLKTVKGIDMFGETHRFIPALIAMRGYSVSEMKVNHRPRRAGKTKYGLGRLIRGFLDLVFLHFWMGYSDRPLHFFGSLGILSVAVSFTIAFYKVVIELLLWKKSLETGPLLLFAVLLFITGILLTIFGFLVEIQVRTYYSSDSRKPYEIEKIL